jgi:hypothetical protein
LAEVEPPPGSYGITPPIVIDPAILAAYKDRERDPKPLYIDSFFFEYFTQV